MTRPNFQEPPCGAVADAFPHPAAIRLDLSATSNTVVCPGITGAASFSGSGCFIEDAWMALTNPSSVGPGQFNWTKSGCCSAPQGAINNTVNSGGTFTATSNGFTLSIQGLFFGIAIAQLDPNDPNSWYISAQFSWSDSLGAFPGTQNCGVTGLSYDQLLGSHTFNVIDESYVPCPGNPLIINYQCVVTVS